MATRSRTPPSAVPGRLITTYIFDTLAFPDVTGTPKPWLAKSWTSSPDGKTWTFTLNDNVKFHDGMPLTSDDVEFTFDYNLTGPGAAAGVAQGVTYIDTVTAPDPKTVVIQLKTVRPSFLQDIAGTFGFAIMPKHIWSSVTDPAKFQGPTALIGSGPYKLENFDLTTNSFNFVANEDFYLGPAKVRQFQVVPVADALLALERGEVDAASGGNGLIPKIQYDALAKKYKVLTAPGEYNLALFFNPNKGFPYNEKAFRQGVVYGIDRKDMVQRLVDGRGIPGPAGALGPGNEFLNKTLPTYDFDKAKAGALFDQIGLRDRNNDGLRDKPDGSSFKIPLSVSSSDNQEAQLVKEYLRAVGLDVDINAVDQQTSDDRGAKGDYEMAIQHFGGLSGDPSGLITRFIVQHPQHVVHPGPRLQQPGVRQGGQRPGRRGRPGQAQGAGQPDAGHPGRGPAPDLRSTSPSRSPSWTTRSSRASPTRPAARPAASPATSATSTPATPTRPN